MKIIISKNDMLELLKSENFIIGKELLSKSKSLIEKNSNPTICLKDFSEENKAQLNSNFTSLRSKWRLIKGGRQRSNFLERNMKENIILELEKSELELNNLNSVNELTSETTREEKNDRSINSECSLVSITKSWINSKRQKRSKMRAKIQNHLNQTNNFLNEFGLSIKKIELDDSSKHTYNNSFKMNRKRIKSAFK